MYEKAQKIFDYLPIEAGSENLYIQHLSGAFQTLDNQDEPVKAFSVLPFHLLFMLAVQYRVYRISAWKNGEYIALLGGCRTYRKEDVEVIRNNAPLKDLNGHISLSSSVRNLSKIKEFHLFRFLKIIGLKEEIIKKAEVLIDIRGTYAHANGNIEENIEPRINEYLYILEEIQKCMLEINKGAGNWGCQIEKDEFPLDEFFSRKFLESQFSPSDFGDIIGVLLGNENLDKAQWEQCVRKGLELAQDKTILALREIVKSTPNRDRLFYAKNILREVGDDVDFSLEDAFMMGLI